MDQNERLRILTILRKVGQAWHQRSVREQSGQQAPPTWSWKDDVLVFPEINCGFCKAPIKTRTIWSFQNSYNKMVGVYHLRHTQTLRREQPDHPHCLNSVTGDMCLGTSQTLLALLMNAPYPNGLATSRSSLYYWYRDSFNHECDALRTWAIQHSIIEESEEPAEDE